MKSLKLCSLLTLFAGSLYADTQKTYFWPPLFNLPAEKKIEPSPPPVSTKIVIEKLQSICIVDDLNSLYQINGQEGIYFGNFVFPGGNSGKRELTAKLSTYLGRSLTADDLTSIKRLIILYYRNHNHPLVTVQIPEQEITGGNFTLLVQESALDEIKIYGDCYFSEKCYKRGIKVKKGETIDENILLNNLNFLNRNPFRQVDLIYAPGSDPNTTNIEIIAKDTYPLNAYAGIDNTGLMETGRTRWFVGATWANAFHLDQILSFQYTAALNPHKFEAITGSWTIPLPIQHILLFFGGYSRVHAHVAPNPSRTLGTSGQLSMRYDIPVAPSPWLLHEFSVGFDFKRSNNTLNFVEILPVIGQNVNLTQFMCGYNLGYERDHKRLSHKIGFDAQLFFSPFTWIPDQSHADFQSLSPLASPIYVYGRTAVNYKLRLPHDLRFTFLFSAQISNRCLLPSEQFGLGGYNTVRGYEERQLNADNGLLVSAELHSPRLNFIKRPKLKDGLEFLVFLDYGFAHDRHKLPGIKQTEYLLSTGPGIRYAISNYFSTRIDWGIKLHRDHFPGGWSMVHFSVIGSY